MKIKKLKQSLLEAELPFDAIIYKQASSTVPKRKGYKYGCKKGHVRVEPYVIKEKPLPYCTACHMRLGEMNRIERLGRVSIPKR